MRPSWHAFLAVFSCAVAACATGRKDVGEIKVIASPPRTATQVITDYTFEVSEGHIRMESPGNPTNFDLAESGDCLRGNVGKAGNLQEICRQPASNGDPPGLSWWKSETSTLVYTVQLSTDQSRLLIDAGPSHGDFALGQGPAADALRKSPELLGAAFAYGFVPAANASDDGSMLAYSFVVSSGK